MGFIPNEQVTQILDATDIVELIGEYVQLKPAGRNHQACCPFHREKTPSFSVNADKQIFKCFGCGIGGGAAKFLMEMENLSFPESLRFLADRAGIVIREEKGNFKNNQSDNQHLAQPTGINKSDVMAIAKLAAKYFFNNLQTSNKSQEVINYLRTRGINEKIQNYFGLGLAPQGWDTFLNFATKRGVSKELLLAAGLVKQKDNGGLYDTFRDRLMFPIFDVNSRVIAFGARTLGNDKGPKYLNSSESIIFNKSKQLYGLNRAKDTIKELGHAIVMEGYTDVIAAHFGGSTNAVATLGTSITKEHARLLSRYCQKITVMYDSDNAGQKAADRSIGILLSEDLDVRIASVPEGKDPGDLMQEGRVDEFNQIINSAIDLVEYKINFLKNNFDISSIHGKTKIAHLINDLLATVNDGIKREQLRKKFILGLNLPENALRDDFINKQQRPNRKLPTQEIHKSKTVQFNETEQRILKLILNHPQNCTELLELDEDDIVSPIARSIFTMAAHQIAKNSFSLSHLLAQIATKFGDSDMVMPFIDSADMTGIDKEKVGRMIQECLNDYDYNRLMRKRNEITMRMNQTSNSEEYNQLLTQHTALNQQIKHRETLSTT